MVMHHPVLHRVRLLAVLVAAADATSRIMDVEIGPGRQTATLYLGT